MRCSSTVDGVVVRRRSRPSRCASPARRNSSAPSRELVPLIEAAAPGVPNARWIAIRLLDGDAQVRRGAGDAAGWPTSWPTSSRPAERFSRKIALRGSAVSDAPRRQPRSSCAAATLRDDARRRASATRPCDRSTARRRASPAAPCTRAPTGAFDLDQRIDRLVTSPVFGLPIMALLLAVVFWLTIAGANVPSAMLADGFFWFEDQAPRRSSTRCGVAVVDHRLHLARRLSRAWPGSSA